jgi:predicted O-methyltransferase YrrM
VPEFHEEWFGVESQRALQDLFRLVKDLKGDVVEVGCWEGRSTIALATVCHPAFVHAVDTWQGSPGEVSAELAAERDVLATFMRNTKNRNIDMFVMDWREYFRLNRDPIRFLHIDAEHTYENVRDNIEAALPLMVPNGIVCGDDVHHPPVQRAVLEHFPEAQVSATLWWSWT